MLEFKIEIESIENGIVVKINGSKQHYFKNLWGLGKYIQDELEKALDEKTIGLGGVKVS